VPTPLFPLHVVLFPGMGLPLHVFEPRYREMMARVLDGDRTFGVVAIRHGLEVGAFADTYSVGCTARIEELHRFDDGRLALIARGEKRFRIDRRLADDPYPQGDTSTLDDEDGAGAADAMTAARAAFESYVAAAAEASGREIAPFDLPKDPIGCSYVVAAALRVPLPESQGLLEAPDVASRLRLAADLAAREAALLKTIGPPVVRPDVRFSGN
jgi:hypothetical protein